MRRASEAVLTLIVLLLVIDFVLSNRTPTLLALWPLPSGIELPVYLVVAVVLLFGLLAGHLIAWTGRWSARRREKSRVVAPIGTGLASVSRSAARS